MKTNETLTAFEQRAADNGTELFGRLAYLVTLIENQDVTLHRNSEMVARCLAPAKSLLATIRG